MQTRVELNCNRRVNKVFPVTNRIFVLLLCLPAHRTSKNLITCVLLCKWINMKKQRLKKNPFKQ